MTSDLQRLIDAAKDVAMTSEEKEAQRQSFAYGNANIENERVTRETIANEAEKLKVKNA